MLIAQSNETVEGAAAALRAYLLGTVPFDDALLLQRRLHYDVTGDRDQAGLILCEHAGEEQVELLQLDASSIRVASYLTELPPKALAKLGEAFAAGIFNELKSRDFLEADSIATSYASPRRLAISVTQVRTTSPDKLLREKILPVSVALDASGNASAPLMKKLAALGVPDLQVSDLERAVDGKAESFFYSHTAKGSGLRYVRGVQILPTFHQDVDMSLVWE